MADQVVKVPLFTHQTFTVLNIAFSQCLRCHEACRLVPLVQFATTPTLQSNERQTAGQAASSTIQTCLRATSEYARAHQWHLQQHSLVRQISSSMVSKLPPLTSIETATLKSKDGTEIQAKTLWETTPVFMYCIRRPGW